MRSVKPFAGALAAVAGLILAAPGAAGASSWSLDSMVPVRQQSQSDLGAVSCTSAAACVAVGGYSDLTMAERYDGSAWTLQSLPQTGPDTLTSFGDVSCAGGHCAAVGSLIAGSHGTRAAAMSLSGPTPILQYPPAAGAAYSRLSGVSCTSAGACTAVGTANTQTLADRWNGTSWSQQTMPSVSGRAGLGGVSCPTSSACFAVGSSVDGSGRQLTLAERWNGTAWALQSAPTPAGMSARLDRVSCSGPSACTAVGIQYTTDPAAGALLVERWNGIAWKAQSTPATTGAGLTVGAVSCPAASACMLAATFRDSTGTTQPLVERWNGTSWSVQTFPVPSGRHVSLGGLSCASPSSCTAVGGVAGLAPALAEHWDGGTWTIQRTPATLAPVPTDMRGVSCSAVGVCTAVGEHDSFADTAVQSTLVERLSAGRWRMQTSLGHPGSRYDELSAVSCPSVTACTAVGSYSVQTTQGPILTLAERWNGSVWAVQSSPNPPGSDVVLSGVSCPSSNACTAVGSYDDAQDGAQRALAEGWNGTTWAVQPIPSPAGTKLSAVSCTSVTACTAVGSTYDPATGNVSPRGERWNGSVWTAQSVPQPAGGGGALSSVSCNAPRSTHPPGVAAVAPSCVAVGGGAQGTFAERWNGSAWRVEATPPNVMDLSGVSCTPTTSCTAVGAQPDPASKDPIPLAETRGPSGWVIQSTPTPANPDPNGSVGSSLSAVSCPAAGACTAVGSDPSPFAEQYS